MESGMGFVHVTDVREGPTEWYLGSAPGTSQQHGYSWPEAGELKPGLCLPSSPN